MERNMSWIHASLLSRFIWFVLGTTKWFDQYKITNYIFQKCMVLVNVVMHAYNPSSWGAEKGGLNIWDGSRQPKGKAKSSKPAWAIYTEKLKTTTTKNLIFYQTDFLYMCMYVNVHVSKCICMQVTFAHVYVCEISKGNPSCHSLDITCVFETVSLN